jgi:hypothetical protein
MKQLLGFLTFCVVLFSGCSSGVPDWNTVEKEKLNLADFGTPIELNVLKGSKAFKGAEPEDMLGMYTIFLTKVRAPEHFAVEVICTTLPGMTVEEVLNEKGGALKMESGFSKIIAEKADGFFFETKEINGDFNYSFIKVFVTEDAFIIVSPEPKSDGNTSMLEAKFMYDILNAN